MHFLNIYKMCLTQKLTSITFNYHLLAIIKYLDVWNIFNLIQGDYAKIWHNVDLKIYFQNQMRWAMYIYSIECYNIKEVDT